MATNGAGIIDGVAVVPTVNIIACSGCGRCVAACHLRLITLEVSGFRKTARLSNVELCTRCGVCVKSCLLNALA